MEFGHKAALAFGATEAIVGAYSVASAPPTAGASTVAVVTPGGQILAVPGYGLAAAEAVGGAALVVGHGSYVTLRAEERLRKLEASTVKEDGGTKKGTTANDKLAPAKSEKPPQTETVVSQWVLPLSISGHRSDFQAF